MNGEKQIITHSDYHWSGLDGLQRNQTHDGYWAAVERREQRERFTPLTPENLIETQPEQKS